MPCSICKEEVQTEKVEVKIDLGHEIPFPMVSTRDVCRVCYEALRTTGVMRARTAKLVLA